MTKRELTPLRRKLLEQMQDLNFGRIEHLAIRNGEPAFSPPPRIVVEFKTGTDAGPRPEIGLSDFRLKPEMIELFEHMDRIRDGEIEVIEVKYGLAFRISYERRMPTI